MLSIVQRTTLALPLAAALAVGDGCSSSSTEPTTTSTEQRFTATDQGLFDSADLSLALMKSNFTDSTISYQNGSAVFTPSPDYSALINNGDRNGVANQSTFPLPPQTVTCAHRPIVVVSRLMWKSDNALPIAKLA